MSSAAFADENDSPMPIIKYVKDVTKRELEMKELEISEDEESIKPEKKGYHASKT